MRAIDDPVVIAQIVELLVPDDDEPPEIDVSYDPKRIGGRREPGANSTTRAIYEALVAAGDQGRTVDELVDELEFLIGTGEYRKYERQLRMKRERRAAKNSGRRDTVAGRAELARRDRIAETMKAKGSSTDADGNFTSEFMRRGRQWAIREALHHMVQRRTARRDGDRWYAGNRAPNVLRLWEVRPEKERVIVAPHDPARTEAWNARMAAARGALERAEKALTARTLAKKDASIRELLALVREMLALVRP